MVGKQWAPIGTVDFGPYLTGLKKADAVVAWSVSGDLLRFLKQYRQFGLKTPLLISPATSLKVPYLKELGDTIVGTIGCGVYSWLIDNPTNKMFVTAFETKFKRKPERDSANAYTGTSIVLAAIEATKGDTTYNKLFPAIVGLKLEGPEGPVSFTASGVAITNRYICKASVVNGEYGWKPIYTYSGVRDPKE